MKKFKNLKYVVIICMLMAFNSCSNDDNSLEIIDETSVEELNVVTTKSSSTCDYQVAVNYNFIPGLSVAQRNTLKASYRTHMAQYFTICEVQELGGDCINSEIWSVNGQEYFDADPDEYNQQGSGGNSSNDPYSLSAGTSGSNNGGDPDFDPEIDAFFSPADYEDCFDEKEENLNNHLSGL